MAEAAVGENPPKFFCHVCNVEVQTVSSEFTCPLCSSGFVEELPPSNVSSETQFDNQSIEIDDLDFLATLSTFLTRDGRRPDEANNTNMENSDTDRNSIRNVNPLSVERNSSGTFPLDRFARNNAVNDVNLGPSQRTRRSRLPNFERFDNVLLEILHTLSGGTDGSLGNASMFFMGNPGDYAWGREGIDTIVTQLLNQMDTTGPPPLSKEKIDEIPIVKIDDEQVKIKLQCSVCWEDFVINELVRKLPCSHLYHENCIVPWLELHGTCPICRKILVNEFRDFESSSRTMSNENMESPIQRDGNNEDIGESYNNAQDFFLQQDNNARGSILSEPISSNPRRLQITLPRLNLFENRDFIFSNSLADANSNQEMNQDNVSQTQSLNNSDTRQSNMSDNKENDEQKKALGQNNEGGSSNIRVGSSSNNFSCDSSITNEESMLNETPQNVAGTSQSCFKLEDGQIDYEID